MLDRLKTRSTKIADYMVSNGRWAADSINRDPVEMAKDLREIMLEEMKPGETLVLGSGTWNLGLEALRLFQGTLAGRGSLSTFITCSQELQKTHCGIDQTRGSNLQDLTVTWKPKDDLVRGGQAVGFADVSYTGPGLVAKMLRVCAVSYGSVAWYIWGGGGGHKFFAQDSKFIAGRIAVEQGMGSGPDCVDMTLDNCSLITDFETYGGAGGDIGDTQYGFLLSGGKATMNGGSITCKKGIGACTGSWDPNASDYKTWPHMILNQVKIDAQIPTKQQIGLLEVH